MEMKELNTNRVCEILNEIVELEMAGVVRYAHSSLMVTGPNRIPIVQFLQEQLNVAHKRIKELTQARDNAYDDISNLIKEDLECR